jgi:hypothetical protein
MKKKTNKHKGIGLKDKFDSKFPDLSNTEVWSFIESSVKDTPKKRIIAWAKKEIEEYQKLIKILEKK